MEKEKNLQLKKRLGDQNDTQSNAALQKYALYYHKDIVSILDMIKRELLLVMKTNNYLKAIDRRLGNPNNTFTVINEITWSVYRREVSKSYWQYLRESFRYWGVRVGLFFLFCQLRLRMMMGLHYDSDELQDFELDVTHHIKEDSLMGLAVATKIIN